MFTTNIYAEAYQKLLQEDKKTYRIVLKDNPEEVIGEFSSGVKAYIAAQKYTKEHLEVPINVIEISAEGEKLLNTFIGIVNARENFHMSDYNAYLKRAANKEKYAGMAAASAEKRQAKTELREKIAAIREEATAKIAELKAEIERIRVQANDKIIALKAQYAPEEQPAEVPAEGEGEVASVPAEDEGMDVTDIMSEN